MRVEPRTSGELADFTATPIITSLAGYPGGSSATADKPEEQIIKFAKLPIARSLNTDEVDARIALINGPHLDIIRRRSFAVSVDRESPRENGRGRWCVSKSAHQRPREAPACLSYPSVF